MFMRGSPSWQGRANSESLTTLGLVPLVVRILVHLLAELARLYGGTGSKSLRLVSTRNAFFGSILFLFNFRESVWPPTQVWSGTKTLGNINVLKS